MPADYLHNHPQFAALIRIVAQEKGVDPALVEKDYWIMHCLYGLQQLKLKFELKGGTSLSKGHKIINRFSEDIDIQIHPPPDMGVKTARNQTKPAHLESRKKFYDWLAETIRIDGIVMVARDTAFDNKDYFSGGIRLHGYRGTSIRRIAQEAGLQKASIYYYFAGKEQILRAMTEDIMKPSVNLVRTLDSSALSAAARLYYFLFFDVRHICSALYDYSWLLTVSETRSGKFAEFWKDRDRLLAWIGKTIRSGIAAGQFRKTDIATAASALFALDEFTVTWFRSIRAMTEARTALFVADLALRSILAKQETLTDVQNELTGQYDPRLPPDVWSNDRQAEKVH